jgi:TatD DNase family protein
MDRLLIETDAPYLAPVPYRGKTNEPGFVLHVAEEIAKLRGLSVETVAEITTNNFVRLFPGTRQTLHTLELP